MKSTSTAAETGPSLPVFAKAATAIHRGGVFAGRVAVARLPRLAAALDDTDGELAAELHVARSRDGRPHLFGRLHGSVALVCQRCLRPFRWALEVPVELRLVDSEAEETAALHDGECWRIEDDRLPLHEIVEEEALLALPLAPRCGREDCGDPR